MKKFLLPVGLICFSILCLTFIHVDNMKQIDKKKMALDNHNTVIFDKSIE